MYKLSDLNKSKILLFLIFATVMVFASSIFVDDVSAAERNVTTNIQDAIGASGAGDTILLKEGETYSGNGNVVLNITKSLTIKGMGSGAVIDAQNNNRIINSISNGVTLNLINITFTGGYAASAILLGDTEGSNGGAIYINSGATVHITDCNFKNNNVKVKDGSTYIAKGGAIYNSGNLYITNCNFVENFAINPDWSSIAGQGGAIYNDGTNSVLSIKNSNFTKNEAKQDGSAANPHGGAIYINSGGTLVIDYCNFVDNKGRWGGAIYYNSNGATTLKISNSTFNNNRGWDYGGAIYSDNNLEVTSSVFSNNNAGKDGGAVYTNLNGKSAKIEYSIFYSNVASGSGSDCYNYKPLIGSRGTLTLNNNFWGSNSAPASSRFAGSGTITRNNYYMIYITIDASTGALLIGEELPYKVSAYFNNGVEDPTGSEKLPFYLVPLRKEYNTTHPLHPQTDIVGQYLGSNETTIWGQFSQISVYFTGTNTHLDTKLYESSPVYKPFIKNVTVNYENGTIYGIYGKNTTITGRVVDIYDRSIIDGTVTITIPSVGTFILDSSQFDGENFILAIVNNFTGKKNVTIYYDNTINHARAHATSINEIDVHNAELTINVGTANGTYGANGIINGTVDGIVDGDEIWLNITFANGTSYLVNASNGKFSLNIPVNFVNDFNFNITIHNSTGYYDFDVVFATFNVIPKNLNANIILSTGVYGSTGVISGRVTGIVGSDVVVIGIYNSNGDLIGTATVNPVNGWFSYNLPVNFADNLRFYIGLYDTNGTYKLSPVNGLFFVIPKSLTISIDASEGVYNGTGVINGTVNGIINNDAVVVAIYHRNGTLLGYANVNNGVFQLENIPVDVASDFYFVVTPSGSSEGKYIFLPVIGLFHITPKVLNVTINTSEGVYNGTGVINGTVNGIVNGTTVYLDIFDKGGNYLGTVELINGTFQFTLPVNFTNGFDFEIKFNSSTDGLYELSETFGTFNVLSANLTISNVVANGTYGGNGVVSGFVDGVVGTDDIYLDIYVNGTYLGTVKLENGSFQLNLSNIGYTADVRFELKLNNTSQGLYNLGMIQGTQRSSDTSGVFKVNPVDLSIVVGSSNGTYGQNASISGTVGGILNNDKVVLHTKINGVDYYAIVNSDGSFTFNLGAINYKTQNYVIDISSSEGLYNVPTSANTFTVAKGKMVSNITVTENPDGTSTVVIKLTDAVGNPIQYQVVRVLVDSKFVTTVITDENGLATAVLSASLSAGKHKISIAVGNDNYEDHSNIADFTKSDNGSDNGSGNGTDNVIPNNNSVSGASMKQTGIPLIAILLVLLSSLIVISRKKQN